jgi:pimeloyl-ACP methyl ester carboxylesterase
VRRLLVVPILALALSAPAAAAAPSVVSAPIKTVKAGQGKIGYRSVGTGRPLVMIMGLSGTMDAWAPAFVDELAKHRRVIVFDNEGIRKTTLGKGRLSLRRMGDDTASLIRALKLRRPDVLGWSMGGMIAQSFARRYPLLVRRLVLCATAPGDRHARGPSGTVLDALLHPERNPAALLNYIFPPGQEAARDAFVSGISSYPNAMPIAPAAVTAKQLTASTAWLLGQEPSGHPLSKLKLPVLVAGGNLDELLPIQNEWHIAGALPHATLKTYPDAGHAFLFQHPEFAGEVERFLG